MYYISLSLSCLPLINSYPPLFIKQHLSSHPPTSFAPSTSTFPFFFSFFMKNQIEDKALTTHAKNLLYQETKVILNHIHKTYIERVHNFTLVGKLVDDKLINCNKATLIIQKESNLSRSFSSISMGNKQPFPFLIQNIDKFHIDLETG